jgi:hypothetical protein
MFEIQLEAEEDCFLLHCGQTLQRFFVSPAILLLDESIERRSRPIHERERERLCLAPLRFSDFIADLIEKDLSQVPEEPTVVTWLEMGQPIQCFDQGVLDQIIRIDVTTSMARQAPVGPLTKARQKASKQLFLGRSLSSGGFSDEGSGRVLVVAARRLLLGHGITNLVLVIAGRGAQVAGNPPEMLRQFTQ